uniref:Uncharacterized protein n=1 Tax=Podoviridae sp. ctnCN2 TaxID=2825274 RepID=A0A8S5PLT5_9CAUD|nr:MAG TPA: hypothetical protein [Podoviridae sp. ctnCN2]
MLSLYIVRRRHKLLCAFRVCCRFCAPTFYSRRCVFAFVAALRQFVANFVNINISKC